MNKVRVGVVGCGMGSGHARSYRLANDLCELTWVADLDEARAKSVAADAGCRYTTDWESGLEDVDAVSVCTPHHLHKPQSIRAMRAGKHVLVEKPMANSEAECLEMDRVANDAGVRLMVAYVMRFRPAVRFVKGLIDDEAYGRPFNINSWTQSYLPPRPPDSWFSRKETLGGGVLFSHGCHYLDLILWFMGQPVEYRYLGTRNNTEWLEGEGTAQTILAFPDGALAQYQVSWGMKHKRLGGEMHVHCPEGLIVLSYGSGKVEVVTDAGARTLFEEQRTEPTLGEIRHFLGCILEEKDPETGTDEALKALRLIWSMYAA